MYAGAKVWALVGTGSQSTWVKAKVLAVARERESEGVSDSTDALTHSHTQSQSQSQSPIISKFSLEIENLCAENRLILSHSLGEQLEIVTSLVSGCSDEYESVKLRNVIDDFETNTIEDLVNLHHLHECSILNCLDARYQSDRIYTSTGPVLISVNPYKSLDIYSPAVVQRYREAGEQAARRGKTHRDTNLPPHVYLVADLAYRHMAAGRAEQHGQTSANQSILVSGESGAG